MRPHVVIKRFIVAGLSLLLVLFAVRLLAIQGWLFPARVTTGSMADSFLGEHYLVECGECGIRFPFGAESKPRNDRAVCPNCGWDGNSVRSQRRDRGQRVLIDRAAYWFSEPQRFDVVAFYDPAHASRLIVKRVLGLPREQLEIRDGELWVDGKLVRKSLAQFRVSATRVHDNHHLAHHGSEIFQRWKSEHAETGWVPENNGFRWNFSSEQLGGDSDREMPIREDWLAYEHWRCYASPHPRTDPAPISDNLGYNQGESRALQDVADVVLECVLRAERPGTLVIRIHDGCEWFTLSLDVGERRATIHRGEEVVAETKFVESRTNNRQLEFGVIDQQLVLGIDSREVIRQVYEPSNPRQAIAQPLAIKSDIPGLVIEHLMIKRDVYYLDPGNVGQPWQSQTVDASGYFMLGDNPSLSEDSRHWRPPYVPRSAIHGKVELWE